MSGIWEFVACGDSSHDIASRGLNNAQNAPTRSLQGRSSNVGVPRAEAASIMRGGGERRTGDVQVAQSES